MDFTGRGGIGGGGMLTPIWPNCGVGSGAGGGGGIIGLIIGFIIGTGASANN